MLLYHWTERKNLNKILKDGLKKISFCLYLTAYPVEWKNLHKDGILLRVNVPDTVKLTCFEEYKDGTEILCWSDISPDNIELIEFADDLPTKPKSLNS